jgi:hypothetical protein
VVPLDAGPRHAEVLERLVTEHGATSPLVTDAVLAALVIENGALLASTDHDFSRFRGLRWINPLGKWPFDGHNTPLWRGAYLRSLIRPDIQANHINNVFELDGIMKRVKARVLGQTKQLHISLLTSSSEPCK